MCVCVCVCARDYLITYYVIYIRLNSNNNYGHSPGVQVYVLFTFKLPDGSRLLHKAESKQYINVVNVKRNEIIFVKGNEFRQVHYIHIGIDFATISDHTIL